MSISNDSDHKSSPLTDEDKHLLADINSNPKVKSDFLALIKRRGYPSISEYMLTVLRDDASQRRLAKLNDIKKNMFPDGVKNSSEPSDDAP